ncbi:MAG: membrane protein insertion efficiency factor YidD [Ruminococcaceae bacterium]|nr:membrane protein insertion efficiency factor YidD [Oscillospiraceae bacterium]
MRKKTMFKKIFTAPIRFYQKYISPGLGSNCRFYPTCSQYAIEAIEEWGVIIGFFLSLWRLLRCQPFCKGGYDPVPKRKR